MTVTQTPRPAVLGLIGNAPQIEANRLETRPPHLLWKKRPHNPGGSIKGRVGLRMIGATCVFALAEGLGGVESLAKHPALTPRATIPPERRAEAGMSDSLARLSVGIEDARDLIADLACAFAQID